MINELWPLNHFCYKYASWNFFFRSSANNAFAPTEFMRKFCNVHCVNPLTKRINSTELTQQQTVIVLWVIYLSVCVYYIYGFIYYRAQHMVLFYLGSSLMHKVDHDKGSTTTCFLRFSSKTAWFIFVLYLCLYYYVHVIYVANLKCIIHGSAERLFAHIFHTIPADDIWPSNVAAAQCLELN